MKKGFTLIELLIAVSIMATLTGLVAMNVNGSLQKARDAKRKQNLREIRTALDLYFNVNNIYPPSSDATTWPPYTSSETRIKGCGVLGSPTSCDWGSAWNQGGVTYMSTLPKDPQGNRSYYYFRAPSGRLNYVLAAKLERSIDPDIVASKANCDDSADGFVLNGDSTGPIYVVCDTK